MFFIFQYCINITKGIIKNNNAINDNLYFRNTNNNIIRTKPNKDGKNPLFDLDLNFDNFIFIYFYFISRRI